MNDLTVEQIITNGTSIGKEIARKLEARNNSCSEIEGVVENCLNELHATLYQSLSKTLNAHKETYQQDFDEVLEIATSELIAQAAANFANETKRAMLDV